MSGGTITERGTGSWRIRYEGERGADGERKRFSLTVRGTKRDAQRRLRELLTAQDNGTAVDPSKVTIADYLHDWLDTAADISPKTRERYLQLAEHQIIPHLGTILLQRLRPAQVDDWLRVLSRTGLSPRTVGHARRLLGTAYARALRREEVTRNPVAAVRAPKVERTEVEIVHDIPALLSRLDGHRLRIVAMVALASGLRRGELCALAWNAVDKDTIRVERSLEQTRAGLRYKDTKSDGSNRTVALPAAIMELLREHRRTQAEELLRHGLRTDLVFPWIDGSPYPPDALSRDWSRLETGYRFHALRHTHASALIAAGLDVVAVSRRLGHADPAITLRVYSHLYNARKSEEAAVAAIGGLLG